MLFEQSRLHPIECRLLKYPYPESKKIGLSRMNYVTEAENF